MEPVTAAILILVAALIAGGLGWFVGSRPAAEWKARHAERDAEAKELSEKLARMAPELATMSERAARADALAENLDRAREELATLKAERAGFEEQKKLLEESRDRLLKEFENTGAKVLGAAQEKFLERANERFGHSEKTSEEKIRELLDTDEGRLRPDAIVNVPGQKKLVIDAKVSLNAYQAAFEAEDEGERKRHLDLHAKSMRGHVQTLGSKGYQSQFDDAPDYVVMFVPGEHFVAAALEADPELWDFAFRNKVLLATPTNLVAIARTVAQVWRQDTIAREAVEIGKAGAELYDRLAIAAEHMKRVGGGLESAVKNYNKFVGSFERNVLSAGRRLSERGIEIGKREIEEIPQIAETPTYTAEDAAQISDGTGEG